MTWLSAIGNALLAGGSYLVARSQCAAPVATMIAAAVLVAPGVLFHGGATEVHALHAGCVALWGARCVHAGSRGLGVIDHLLLLATAGSHATGPLAGLAMLAARIESVADQPGLRALVSRPVLHWLATASPALVAPTLLVIALEPRLWLAYLQTIFGQVTEARLMAKEALWPYLGNEMFMATSALSLVWLAALLLARPRLRRSLGLVILASYALLFGPIGIPEHGGYFLPLMPVYAVCVAGWLGSLGGRGRILVLVALAAGQTTASLALLPMPLAKSSDKIQQEALLASLPPNALLVLYVPWEASRQTRDYLWPVHDPTRDNLALLDHDPEDILAPPLRDDPPAGMRQRIAGALASGQRVFILDAGQLPPGTSPGLTLLHQLLVDHSSKRHSAALLELLPR
jgi:hypothetical protein